MSAGLKLLLNKVFTEIELHRLEANIQPNNTKSINLVKANGFRKEGILQGILKLMVHGVTLKDGRLHTKIGLI